MYVLAADSVSVPVPSLVSVPVVVAMTLLMSALPAPPTVSGRVAPVTPPDRVSVPASESMRAPPAPRVMAAAQVLSLPRLRSAPPELMPLPMRLLRGSVMLKPEPSISSAAPDVTVVPVATPPRALAFWMRSTPALTEVEPV